MSWEMDFDELWSTKATPFLPVVQYRMEGNALDSSDNGYNGTWTGTEAYVGGVIEGTQAANFNGSSRVSITGGAALNVTSLTVAAWAHVVSAPSSFTGFVSRYIATGDRRTWTVTITPEGAIDFWTGSSSGAVAKAMRMTSLIPFETWCHIAVSYLHGTGVVGMYLNGISAAFSGDQHTSLNQSDNDVPLVVGALSDGVSPLYGYVDDVRIYNRALSQANIQRIMQRQDIQAIEEWQT